MDEPNFLQTQGTGRWYWDAHALPWKSPLPPFGVVTFATKAGALADFVAHRDSGRDDTGRIVLPKVHIEEMLRSQSEAYPECAGATFHVSWHEVDADGCNWEVPYMVANSVDRMLGHLTELRSRYAIPDET